MRLQIVKPKKGVTLPSGFGRHSDIFSVCFVDSRTLSIGVANFTQYLGYKSAEDKYEPRERKNERSKPRLFELKKFNELFERVFKNGDSAMLTAPPFLTMSDSEVAQVYSESWLTRRDKSYQIIKPCLPKNRADIEAFVSSYLRGEANSVIQACQNEIGLSSQTSITRRLNNFIALGLVPNALLPFGYEHCGSNYIEYDRQSDSKRGRPSEFTDYRGVCASDKSLMKKVANSASLPVRGGVLDIGELYYEYLDAYEKENNLPPAFINEHGEYEYAYPQNLRISEGAFRYHLPQLIGFDKWIKLKDGVHKYEKDHKPKRGDSKDGVLGAGHIVEFDHTQLNTHVRLPGVHDKRYSAGRPYLCIAICVYTKYILGFSLSFRPPCWDNIAQCIINSVKNKVDLAAEYGVSISEDDWYSFHIPYKYRIDNGNEYPSEQEDELISSPFNFEGSQQVSPGRGDYKSTSENKLGGIADKIAKNPGGMEKDRDSREQDASQQALLLLEDIGAQIIDEILLHNKTAERELSLDQDMLRAGVDSSPQSQWRYSLEYQMSGGNPVAKSDIPNLTYTLMPKAYVNVKPDGLSLSKHPELQYDADFPDAHHWYMQKKHKLRTGEFTVKVAYQSSSVDCIYYQVEDGTIIPFRLKSQCSQYEGMSYFELEQTKKSRKQMRVERAEQRRAGKQYNKSRQIARIARNEQEARFIPKNTQRNYQKETALHNTQMRREQMAKDAARTHQHLSDKFPEVGDDGNQTYVPDSRPNTSEEFY